MKFNKLNTTIKVVGVLFFLIIIVQYCARKEDITPDQTDTLLNIIKQDIQLRDSCVLDLKEESKAFSYAALKTKQTANKQYRQQQVQKQKDYYEDFTDRDTLLNAVYNHAHALSTKLKPRE